VDLALATPLNNLPAPPNALIGRERELGEVHALLAGNEVRLLTLTGPGGSGKTRLALQAAADLIDDYEQGVWWVSLAALRDPALVEPTIAHTLGAKDGLAGHLGSRKTLLLLDNFEQVVAAAPELGALLSKCPHLSLLVTSRELLRVRGELEYPVPPLAEPEAVALFCARSRLEPSRELAELCSRLDNLPLAVELAAARTKSLSPAQMLKRLAQRLDLLRGGRDADPRQQTLRATIEWSYELLAEDERELFARLSVFAGGCTLEAAEAVCEADLNVLSSLVEKSLLRYENERYWMLETVRGYAAERLEESGAADERRSRHSDYMIDLVAGAEPELRGSNQALCLAELQMEQDNVRAALDFLAWQEDRSLLPSSQRKRMTAVGDFERAQQAEGELPHLRVGDAKPEGRACLDRGTSRSDVQRTSSACLALASSLSEIDRTGRSNKERSTGVGISDQEDGLHPANRGVGDSRAGVRECGARTGVDDLSLPHAGGAPGLLGQRHLRCRSDRRSKLPLQRDGVLPAPRRVLLGRVALHLRLLAASPHIAGGLHRIPVVQRHDRLHHGGPRLHVLVRVSALLAVARLSD
jgi:predicted ATPase